MKKLALCFAFAVASTAFAQERPAEKMQMKDQKEMMEMRGEMMEMKGDAKAAAQAVLDKVATAFDRMDARGVAAVFAEDGQVITPEGAVGKGRAGVEKVVSENIETVFKGGKHKFSVETVRTLRPDLMFVDASHDVTGLKTRDGKDSIHIHFSGLLQKKGDQWMVLEARPYVFQPPAPRQRAEK